MSERKSTNKKVSDLFKALKAADEIRAQLREDPEILEEMAGELQELEDEIVEVQAKLTELNTQKATITSQIALIKGTTAKKAAGGGGGTGRGKSKLAAEYINVQGINATITPNDLKVPEIGMVGGYPGTWLTKQVELGYLEKLGQGNYKVIKKFPV